MKKKYIIPVLNIVQTATYQMVAVSKLDVDSEKTTSTQYTKDQGSWGDVWGSDDDDE